MNTDLFLDTLNPINYNRRMEAFESITLSLRQNTGASKERKN